jgi:hypothetical protein
MGPNDVWLTVQVQPPAADGSCTVSLPGQDGGKVAAQMGGRSVDLELRDPPRDASEPTWKAYAVTGDGQRCYVLWFVTLTKETRTRELPTMKEILAKFAPSPRTVPSRAPSPPPPPPPSPSPSP